MHFASPASPRDYLDLPIQTLKVGSLGTHNTLGLAKAKRAGYFLASTSEVYGDPQVHPQREDYRGHVDPIGPRGVYDEAKRFGEAMCMAYHRVHGLDVRIARIFNTYGPNMRPDDGRVVSSFVTAALRGDPLLIHGDGAQTAQLLLCRRHSSCLPGPERVVVRRAGQHRQHRGAFGRRSGPAGAHGDRLDLDPGQRRSAGPGSFSTPSRHRSRRIGAGVVSHDRPRRGAASDCRLVPSDRFSDLKRRGPRLVFDSGAGLSGRGPPPLHGWSDTSPRSGRGRRRRVCVP